MRAVTGAVVLIGTAALAWLFRYEQLPPTAFRVGPPVRLAAGVSETVVACRMDRWTRAIECERVEVRPSAAEIQQAAREYNDRLLAPYPLTPGLTPK